MNDKNITKNYLIWTLILSIVFSLLTIGGIVFFCIGIASQLILTIILGILLFLIGGFMSVLMWIAYSTAVKTYNRKISEVNEKQNNKE